MCMRYARRRSTLRPYVYPRHFGAREERPGAAVLRPYFSLGRRDGVRVKRRKPA
jgi:hypothetical protein